METRSLPTFALGRLPNLVIEEYEFLEKLGSGHFIGKLQKDLNRTQELLEEADQAAENLPSNIRDQVFEIRRLSFDLENVIDEYVAEEEQRKIQGTGEVPPWRLWFPSKNQHQVKKQIKKYKRKISELTKNLQNHLPIHKKNEVGAAAIVDEEDEPWKHSFREHIGEKFVGREKDVVEVVRLLVVEKQHRVVSVWGPGGLGKTTLARKVCQRDDVRSYFDGTFALITLGQQFDTKVVLKCILKELNKTEGHGDDESQLFKQLHEILLSRRCLVVIDDIWTVEAWERLRPGFPKSSEAGSKILLTTRTSAVADQGGGRHNLGCLSEEQSWELFRNKTIPPAAQSNSSGVDVKKKEKFGRELVGMCKGIPLAILLLGGFMATKQTAREWELARARINKSYRTEDIIDLERKVNTVLYSSYDDLPYKLKPCFLSLGNFREDQLLGEEEIFELWIGEGMVTSSNRRLGKESWTDVAKQYLHNLEQRSLIERFSFDDTTQQYLKVHDVVRDMCLSKGRDDNFVGLVELNRQSPAAASTSRNAPWNRLSININTGNDCNLEAVNNCLKEAAAMKISPNLQSLNIRAKAFGIQLDILRSSFKFLRVLRLDGMNLSELETIGDLIHLRTLRLHRCRIRELPLAIGKLTCLQVLDLFGMMEFEGSLEMLQTLNRLVHLTIVIYEDYNPEQDERVHLRNFRNLERFEISASCMYHVIDLFHLTRLRWFRSKVYGAMEDLRGIVEYLFQCNSSDQLEYACLDIIDCDLSSRSSSEGTALLEQLFQCQRLNALDLYYCNIDVLPTVMEDSKYSVSLLRQLRLCDLQLNEDPIPMLEKFPKLEILRLSTVFFYGAGEIVFSANGFPSLLYLQLHKWFMLEWIWVEEGAMPKLCTFSIDNCVYLEMIPEGLRHIASLRELQIYKMPPEFGKRLKVIDGEEGEDLYKVRHVPSITFID